MDDLYSKAGRQYPLRTDSANWEAVAKQLSGGGSPPLSPKTGFPYGWLSILIIPIVFFAVKKAELISKKQSPKQVVEHSALKPGVTNNIKSGSTDKVNSSDEIAGSADKTGNILIERENKSKDVATTQPNISSSRTTKPTEVDRSPNIANDRLPGHRSLTSGSKKDKSSIAVGSFSGADASGDNEISGTGRKSTAGLNRVAEMRNELAFEKQGAKTTRVANEIQAALDAGLLGRLPRFGPAWDKLSIGDRGSLFNGDSILSKPYQQLPARKGLLPDGYFYYGMTIAPDLSFIKSQAIKNVGFNLGLLVGYHFANRVSLEGAFLWDRKKYYTSGKYFDKRNAGIPDYVWVKSVDGGCDMFEIPISVRYDFSYKPSTFFASVGLNSYLMKKDEYVYDAIVNNIYYRKHMIYDNPGNHFLASLSLTAGYSLKVARNTNIRFEPYYKIPLTKIGTGNMSLTSTGINLSLVQQIP